MWIQNITVFHLLVAIVSVYTLIGYVQLANDLRRAGSKQIAYLLFGTAAEIGLAALAVFMDKAEWWAVVRVGGRLIENICRARLRRYLRNGGGKR